MEVIAALEFNYNCMCLHCQFCGFVIVGIELGFVLGSWTLYEVSPIRFLDKVVSFWSWYILIGVKTTRKMKKAWVTSAV